MNFEVVLDRFEAFVGVNLFTMIFAWINLILLYFILRKLLFKPVKKMIDDRQNEIDGMYEDAEGAKQTAEQLRSEYEEKISHAEEESEQILRSAVRRAQLREEEILKEAGEKAARTLERASEQIELEKKKAINDVKNEVSDMAIGIAEAVIERDISKKDHDALINDFISKMGEQS